MHEVLRDQSILIMSMVIILPVTEVKYSRVFAQYFLFRGYNENLDS